jgi:hypothetical protein
MHFVCTGKPHETGYKFVEKIYRRSFALLGYDFSMRHATNKEAVELLRTEQVDGDCGRVAHFAELSGLTNTLSVSHAYRMIEFSAWTKTGQTIASSRADQRIGYNHNALFIPFYLADMGYGNSVAYESNEAMIKGLINGEVDILMNYHAGMAKLQASPYAEQITYHSHILSVPMHGLLLKKHQHLAQQLSENIARFTKATPYRQAKSNASPERTHLKALTFSCAIPASNQFFIDIGKVLNRAFNDMGYQITLQSMTRAREIAELKNNRVDGSCGRTSVLAENIKEYASKLNVPVTKSRFQVWSTQPDREITHIKQLPPNSKIAVVRGTESLTNILRRYASILISVNTAQAGLQLLAEGKADYYLDIIESAGPQLERISSQVPIYLSGEIQGYSVYPLIHNRHKYLQQQATELLQNQLEKTGGDHLIQYN